ncbi:MAG: LysE family translocator [Pseudomonadota bacterium]
MALPIDLLAYLPFAFAVIGTPGPANVVLMAAGARFGMGRVLPLILGVIFGKQFVIWPLGFGLMGLAAEMPLAFAALKWASIAYMLYLAWKVAALRIRPGVVEGAPPGFIAGLIVHPMNPKAWAMVTASFATFVDPAATTFAATFAVAAAILFVQFIMQPLYAIAGDRMARAVAGTPAERWIMWALAAATVLSVLYVVLKGG